MEWLLGPYCLILPSKLCWQWLISCCWDLNDRPQLANQHAQMRHTIQCFIWRVYNHFRLMNSHSTKGARLNWHDDEGDFFSSCNSFKQLLPDLTSVHRAFSLLVTYWRVQWWLVHAVSYGAFIVNVLQVKGQAEQNTVHYYGGWGGGERRLWLRLQIKGQVEQCTVHNLGGGGGGRLWLTIFDICGLLCVLIC